MTQKKRKPAPLLDLRGRLFPPPPADVRMRGATPTDKIGRPYAIKDVEGAISVLSGLGSIMATTKECAAVLGVSEHTLFAFWTRHPEAKEAWETGKQHGKVSLRRKQYALADKNATMAIFLGMNILEQRDRREFAGDPRNPIKHEHTGKVDAAVTNTIKHDLSKLSLDELARLHGEATATPRKD